MGRDLRYLPRPGSLVELTQRTIQQRCLFRPGRRLNQLVVGVLARAQQTTGMRVHAVAVMSNHFHLLASPADVEQMAAFMRHVNANLSKEVGRLHDWRGPMFDRRYSSIPVSDEPEAQIARLRYLLSHGVKEGLVLSPADWPGVHSAEALLGSGVMRGKWVDRTLLFAARQRGEDVEEADFETDAALNLDPLPCWSHHARAVYRDHVRELMAAIEQEALARHRREGTAPRGARWVQSCHPHQRPMSSPRTPRPRFHAACKRARNALVEGYRIFEVAFRLAAERLRRGALLAPFPENCFPPGLPFVPWARLEPG